MTLKEVFITCKVGFSFLLSFLVQGPTVSSGVKRYIASKFGNGCRTFDMSSTTKNNQINFEIDHMVSLKIKKYR